MSSTMTMIVLVVVGLLSFSTAVPVGQSRPYRPQDFFPSNQRIVGGSDAPDGFAPYMVALLVGDLMTALMCGGSLISPWRVATAAHCIDPMLGWTGGLMPSARAVVGTNIWSDESTTIQFSGYRNHPDWDNSIIKNDVGFLELAKKVELNERVGLIALNYDWVGGGEKIYVTGWGTTTVWGVLPDRLQVLFAESLSPRQCADGVRAAQALWGLSPPVHAAVEICTKHEHGAGHGTCHGDSGSALVQVSSRQQIGIVSWGFPCAVGAPDMFVRISAFSHWLLAATV